MTPTTRPSPYAGRGQISQNSTVCCFAARDEQTHMSVFAVPEATVSLTVAETGVNEVDG
jgi:hypothetical protein